MTHLLLAFLSFVLFAVLNAAETPNSAMIPVIQDGDEARHAAKVQAARQHSYQLLLIGDSITENLETEPFKAVWDRYFAPRDALNLGYSGARTENILWNLTNGELEGQSPKAVVLLIGTNNSDDANYPIVHSAEQIADGTAAIIALLRARCQAAKILLLRIFPRERIYLHPNGSERGNHANRLAVNTRASELCARLADGHHVFFLDVTPCFLRSNGTIDPAMMPDLLHPSPKGAQAWAEAMDSILTKLMGSPPRGPSNRSSH